MPRSIISPGSIQWFAFNQEAQYKIPLALTLKGTSLAEHYFIMEDIDTKVKSLPAALLDKTRSPTIKHVCVI